MNVRYVSDITMMTLWEVNLKKNGYNARIWNPVESGCMLVAFRLMNVDNTRVLFAKRPSPKLEIELYAHDANSNDVLLFYIYTLG